MKGDSKIHLFNRYIDVFETLSRNGLSWFDSIGSRDWNALLKVFRNDAEMSESEMDWSPTRILHIVG